MRVSFPLYRQLDAMDCGPTCLRMVAKYYGRSVSLDYLRNKSQFGKKGVSLLGLADAAESIGLKSVGARLTIDQLVEDAPLPAIIYWDQYHFVVLTPESTKKKFVIADPAKGIVTLTRSEFMNRWLCAGENGREQGISLLLEQTPLFKRIDFSENAQIEKRRIGWAELFGYVKNNRTYFSQIVLGLLLGSAIQLVFPYLTQGIVDTGINTKNFSFIQIVLIAQIALLLSQTLIDFIRSRILMHISTRINISLLSGFWSKLLRLPIQFFDSKHPGDILQRIGDHHRIESFLTGTALTSLLSLFTLIIFSFVLFNYSLLIFLIFISGTFLYILWISFFLRYRRRLDYQRFSIASRENNATMQLVYGMQEIKLNNAENTYRWSWENLQAELFRLNLKNLSLGQFQQLGALFLNQGKNLLITFFVAKLVIDGQITLGMMLAIQYIIGQLNSPIEQLVNFSQQAQDAKISLERMNDIHILEDEEPVQKQLDHFVPTANSLRIENLHFTYPGAGNDTVLKNISLEIPIGRVTAIVGMSGSGKSTLIKLLLRFYENYKGDIYWGSTNFKNISPRYWRSLCGVVMQDNFIFNDNIKRNIAVTAEKINHERLLNACRVANILTFVESMPLGFNTRLGAEGNGISGGQKQRLSIARAVYKNPHFVFFDEATNSLDANNEKVILQNLEAFFKGKTVLIIAHRLSTVKNADSIIVMDKGEITESGTHEELIQKKGKYFELVKNQLDLGN